MCICEVVFFFKQKTAYELLSGLVGSEMGISDRYNGFAEECNDHEILDAILLLAQTEGIFTEPAGGVSISVLQKMVEQGKIDKNDKVVCYVTGNGLKATESIMQVLSKPTVYKPNINEISAVVQ